MGAEIVFFLFCEPERLMVLTVTKYTIQAINGPVVTVCGGKGLAVLDTVYVGHLRLIGEVVSVRPSGTVVQVYEDTAGLLVGEPIETTDAPLSILLGPGLLSGIFDGIARPLRRIEAECGSFIKRGVNLTSLNTEASWNCRIVAKVGDMLSSGAVYAEVQETSTILHKCLVPPALSGTVVSVGDDGQYKVTDTVVTIKDVKGILHELTLCQTWPIRKARPFLERMPITYPLITGQRIIDTLFPVAKGGCAAVPGPFGAGKTITQHQLAKWSDADIIVYIGCGERGNEMTQVLEEFSELKDPKTGRPLMERTILIANTSNMPVAAREASIYTGVTIAEYYRDMGYAVAVMADSTSRWAEALREISGRLEEMPAEEGYPAYLPSRLAEFYERAGYIKTLSGEEGSLTIIGAVSPQGGDFSEPVTQNTKRFIRTFWALDRQLAYARHFPSIHWINSYSEYFEDLRPWYEAQLGADFVQLRSRVAALLQEESQLMEIVKLIGSDILPDDQKLTIEIARVIRTGFLQQNAYHAVDTYVPLTKQKGMLAAILCLYDEAKRLLQLSIPIVFLKDSGIFDRLARMKYDVPNDDLSLFTDIHEEIVDTVDLIIRQNS